MISYIHHINIHAAYCVNNDVLSDYPAEWKISYTIHRKRGTLHWVQQMTFFPEWLLTLTTYIWIISTMYMPIFPHDTSLTHNTRILPLLRMYQFMPLQNTALSEGLVANTMRIWPIPTMYVLIFLDSTMLSEWWITHVSRIQTLPSVHVLMMLLLHMS
jgi:hypothetical protein